MKFFFPDSLDQVDPDYDFLRDEHPPGRVRQRTDLYAHEILSPPPYDGLLVSMTIVSRSHGRYSISQAVRLRRQGVRQFFRLEAASPPLSTMGDCGAYTYLNEPEPPFSVGEVLDFYGTCGFDYVLSVDHVIPVFHAPGRGSRGRSAPEARWRERQDLTLSLAAAFLREHRHRGSRSTPLGVAQGWDPASYAHAVESLEKIGYSYIALGGLAALPTVDILSVLEACVSEKRPGTRFHLLGVSRLGHLKAMARLGAASFDTTMPLRQAFMDDKHNYHTLEGAYLALRVPQVDGNVEMRTRVRQGHVTLAEARQLERRCLETLRGYDSGATSLGETVDALREYEAAFNGREQTEAYRKLLEERPWKNCGCAFCRALGIEITVLRGKERNKRRGFHNLHVLSRRLQSEFGAAINHL